MIKKITLLLLTACLIVSCGLDYDGDTKILYKGTVTDDLGSPLSGIPVYVIMYNSSESETIAYSYTNANGNFRIAAPRAKNGIPKIYINKTDYTANGVNTDFSDVEYHNINQETLNGYTLNLGNTILCRTTNTAKITLNFSFGQIVKTNITGIVAQNSIDLDFPINNFYNNYDSLPYSEYYNDTENVYYVKKNQALTLRYMKNDETIYEQPVNVGEQDLTITIP